MNTPTSRGSFPLTSKQFWIRVGISTISVSISLWRDCSVSLNRSWWEKRDSKNCKLSALTLLRNSSQNSGSPRKPSLRNPAPEQFPYILGSTCPPLTCTNSSTVSTRTKCLSVCPGELRVPWQHSYPSPTVPTPNLSSIGTLLPVGTPSVSSCDWEAGWLQGGKRTSLAG